MKHTPSKQELYMYSPWVRHLCQCKSPHIYQGNILSYVWEDPVVSRLLFLTPDSRKEEVLRCCHDLRSSEHLGQDITLSNLRKAAYWYKMSLDCKVYVYKVGGIVFKIDPARKVRVCPKLKAPLKGLFVVAEVKSPVLYKIRNKKTTEVIYHDRLKLSQVRDLPIWTQRLKNKILEMRMLEELIDKEEHHDFGLDWLFSNNKQIAGSMISSNYSQSDSLIDESSTGIGQSDFLTSNSSEEIGRLSLKDSETLMNLDEGVEDEQLDYGPEEVEKTPVEGQMIKGSSNNIERSRLCCICTGRFVNIRRQVLRAHVPWYTAPLIACWTCQLQFGQKGALNIYCNDYHNVEQTHGYTNEFLGDWLERKNGLLIELCRQYKLTTLDNVVLFARQMATLNQCRKGNADWILVQGDKDLREQIKVLRVQLELIKSNHLTVVVHCRGGENITSMCLDIMTETLAREHGVHLHCFIKEYENIKRCFPNTKFGISPLLLIDDKYPHLSSQVCEMQLEDITLEGDSPYIHPKLYEDNSSLLIKVRIQKLAIMFNTSGREIAAMTTRNAQQIHKWK
ncbi:tatD [Mytilus coruscus]|uniref:TatD n=1 Tax=Mytilus coruscus TaxID=42192 RepID=A0A6J8F063_MYTCO|nr:tatD [Mytilus coruscus]